MLERFRKQTRLPDKIVCWLSEEEYNGVVPHELRKFADDGFVEIGWTSNTFSFKKYEIFKEHGKDFVFLIDDDIYYEDSYIEDMYNAALSHKDNVICCYGSNMSYYYDSRRTPLLKNPSLSSSYDSFAVCFPPNVFPMEYFECADIRDSISPKSENVFMQSLCIKNNIPIYCLNDYYLEQPEFIPGSEETALGNENRKKTNNITKDAIVFKNLIREFGIGKKCCELFPKLKQEPEVVIKCEKKQKENIEGKADGKEKENKKPDKSDIVKKQKEADNAEKTKPAKQEEKKKVSDKENNKVQEKKNPKYEQGVSICITAYNSQDYIEECLDSVALQNWFKNHDNWEILLGIDGCEKTLLKMKDIMHKYRNLRVFMMDRNVGTYITSNTIMFNAKYSHLIRFDSDDIMLPEMVGDIMKVVSDKPGIDVVKYRCITFTEKEILDPNRYLEGSICIRKDKFIEYGGYMPWRCSSDSELKKRLDGVLKFHNIKKPLCKVRRDNKYSITKTESTNMESDYRKKNNEYINTKSAITTKIEYVTAPYKEIDFNKFTIDFAETNKFIVDKIDYTEFLKCKNKIHILIVDYKQLKYTQHLISNLLIQDTPFDLTVFEQKPDNLSKRYFNDLKNGWCFSECELNVVFNSVNAPLNHIWNWFYSHTNNDYLAFLNNDIEICNNFISNAEQIFDKEKKCGIIIHPTNRREYTKNDNLIYEKVNGYPVLQGWDFIINRKSYSVIPDELWIWRGDVYLMTSAYNNGWEQIYDISSPILHYTSSTVNKHKNDIQKILDKDRAYWKELNLKECTSRSDNKYTHRLFNGIYPIDLTKKVIVSFTTWEKRITNVPGVVEQMMRQTKKPDLIILNLSCEEFKSRNILLKDVFLLEKSNPIFKVNMVDGENTKVWKKWIPIIDKYNNDLIIPIDDDIVYPNDFIERLYNKWLENPYNPITGALVTLGDFLQHHCGAGSLIFRQSFGIYINDYKKIMDELNTSDVFYSFAAYMNGYDYIKEGMNVLKFERHDEIAPYSQNKRKTLTKQPHLIDFNFLSDYYLHKKII